MIMSDWFIQFHNCRQKKGTNKESSNDRSLRYTSEPADVFVRLSRRNWRILCPLTIFRYAEKKKNCGTVKVAMLSLFCSGCSWPLCTYFTTVLAETCWNSEVSDGDKHIFIWSTNFKTLGKMYHKQESN